MSELDAQLKLQAFLDGELPPAEAAEVLKAWLEGNAEEGFCWPSCETPAGR